jgi:two-component sensor histidine kinase
MLRLFQYTFLTRAWPIWVRYLATFLIVVTALALRMALTSYMPGSPFLVFMLAIILCAALFDQGSGIFAVLLSAALAKWFLIEPTGTLDIASTQDIGGLSIFIAIGLITASILEALHKVASDLADANARLVAAESEKDLVLQEASHRFKNELAMLSALLRLQERGIENETARRALASTADRVQVLARVHERLQRAEKAAVVDMREFIVDLCDDLRVALIGLRPVVMTVEAESHRLPQERAVAVGLVINELLTNALKYAFPEDRSGTVKVRFMRQEDGFCLEVIDNGIGVADDREPDGSGLGQRLIHSMVTQLQGSVEIAPDSGAPGTNATVRFPADPV